MDLKEQKETKHLMKHIKEMFPSFTFQAGRVKPETLCCVGDQKDKYQKFELLQIVMGFVGGSWLDMCVGQWMVYRVNELCSLVGRWVGVLSNEEKKPRSQTDLLSSLDRLFRSDLSCKCGGWWTCSCLAKLAGQIGGLLVHPAFFFLSNFLLSIPFVVSSVWFTNWQRLLTFTEQLHREL